MLRWHTFPVGVEVRPLANASTARMEATSCTRALVSWGLVEWERSWESFAWRQGWEEMWMFGGRVIALGVEVEGEVERGCEEVEG